jgi:hypothetical protein
MRTLRHIRARYAGLSITGQNVSLPDFFRMVMVYDQALIAKYVEERYKIHGNFLGKLRCRRLHETLKRYILE